MTTVEHDGILLADRPVGLFTSDVAYALASGQSPIWQSPRHREIFDNNWEIYWRKYQFELLRSWARGQAAAATIMARAAVRPVVARPVAR
jgi:hypothetical protein